MNRYWLFQEYHYEAAGGLGDLMYTFKSVQKAKNYVDKESCDYDISYIVDSKTWESTWYIHGGRGWVKSSSKTSYDIGEPAKE